MGYLNTISPNDEESDLKEEEDLDKHLEKVIADYWAARRIYDAARTAHEVNRAYCQAIGDNSQPTWADAPLWQRTSAIEVVRFHQDNPEATPENSHESWLKTKVADGWVYGPVKDPEKKEHPCMRPYAELPLELRVKDHLFRAVVHAMGRGESNGPV